MSDPTAFDRFVTIAKRELQAEDVRMLAASEPAPEAGNVVVLRLEDGRHVVATFAGVPEDRAVLERRLAMLASTFTGALHARDAERGRSRPPAVTSLHEELKVLATRARALDAVVIDTDSPVVWGAGSAPLQPHARGEVILREVSDRELATSPGDDPGPLGAATGEVPAARARVVVPAESAAVLSAVDDEGPAGVGDVTGRAIASLRALPALDSARRGRTLRHVERADSHYFALSFSGIYLLCLVFDGVFDELRAERAAAEALPRIERLVLALPPLDPEPPQPMGGVVALRGRRRR